MWLRIYLHEFVSVFFLSFVVEGFTELPQYLFNQKKSPYQEFRFYDFAFGVWYFERFSTFDKVFSFQFRPHSRSCLISFAIYNSFYHHQMIVAVFFSKSEVISLMERAERENCILQHTEKNLLMDSLRSFDSQWAKNFCETKKKLLGHCTIVEITNMAGYKSSCNLSHFQMYFTFNFRSLLGPVCPM